MNISPEQVYKIRLKTGLTQEEAGKKVYVSRRTWQSWETPSGMANHRKIPYGLAELFCLKSNLSFPPQL